MKHIRDILAGFSLSCLILVPSIYFSDILAAKPYYDVEVLSADWDTEDDNVSTVINFTKNGDCDFKDLAAFGRYLGMWSVLTWVDTEGPPQGDRIEGEHTLYLDIITEGNPYDTIELRTRHMCGEEKVDGVLARLKP